METVFHPNTGEEIPVDFAAHQNIINRSGEYLNSNGEKVDFKSLVGSGVYFDMSYSEIEEQARIAADRHFKKQNMSGVGYDQHHRKEGPREPDANKEKKYVRTKRGGMTVITTHSK